METTDPPKAPPKPRTVIQIVVDENGDVGMTLQGKASLSDVMTAAKFLELEAAHAHANWKAQIAAQQRPRILAPVPTTNGRGH